MKITVKDLEVSYAGKRVLTVDSLELELSEGVVLMGDSGGGKSTLAKVLLDQCKGAIKGHLSTDGKKGIPNKAFAFVGQHPRALFDPRRTVRNQLLQQETDAVIQLLSRLSLDAEALDKYPRELSGGMLQRICAAIALASGKPMILDEPTANIDRATADLLVQEIKQYPHGFFLITHQPEVAAQLNAGKFFVISDGKIVESSKNVMDLEYAKKQEDAKRKLEQARQTKKIHPSTTTAISLREVQLAFGSKEILHVQSLDIFDGESIAFVGSSGCGKSTLARYISGLEKHQGFCNVNTKHKIALVFQDNAFNPMLPIGMTFKRILRTMPSTDEKLAEIFREVGLSGNLRDWFARFPNQVSGGELQRLQLARKLLQEPSILIVDEGFSALDLPTKADLIERVKEIKSRKKLTLIVIDHEPSVVNALCTYRACAINGELTQKESLQ